MRHTGQWRHLHHDPPLTKALRTLEDDPVLQPH